MEILPMLNPYNTTAALLRPVREIRPHLLDCEMCTNMSGEVVSSREGFEALHACVLLAYKNREDGRTALVVPYPRL